jgi:dTDP-glucose pyrophosphorylase
MNYKDLCINAEQTIEEAIKRLNEAYVKILFVVNNKNKLIGTITDGDVRRSLIKDFSMNVKIPSVMNVSPKYCFYKDSFTKRKNILKYHEIDSMPVVDERGIVCGLETLFLESQKLRIDTPVIIMAGGLGSRLGDLTKFEPKPMLKINDRPILEHLISKLSNQGFHDIYITTYYRSEMIVDYFGTGEKWGVNINYILESSPLGTAGSLSLIKNLDPESSIIVTNADLMTSINFADFFKFHIEEKNICTIAATNFQNKIPFGVIDFNGSKLNKISEKPVYNYLVTAGIYIFKFKLIKSIKTNVYLDMPDFINSLDMKKNVGVFPIHEYWTDIGQKEDLNEAKLLLSPKKT